MAQKFLPILAASMVMSGTAYAQAGAVPDALPGATDTSRSVMSDRDQQYAYDNIREEVSSEDRSVKRTAKPRKGRITAATPADLMTGAVVLDSTGATLGTIEAVKPEGVQLLSGASRAMIPADVFGMKDGKLLLNVTKAEFERQTAAGSQ